jgi:hypothetical protein
MNKSAEYAYRKMGYGDWGERGVPEGGAMKFYPHISTIPLSPSLTPVFSIVKASIVR